MRIETASSVSIPKYPGIRPEAKSLAYQTTLRYTRGIMTFGILGQRRLTLLVLAAFCAAGIHQGGAAQVLCIGEDGHVEVESLAVDCCENVDVSGPRGDQQLDAPDEAHTDHCGVCIDFPIITSSRVAAQHVSIDRPDALTIVVPATCAPQPALPCAFQLGHAFLPEFAVRSAAALPLLI